MFLLFQERKRNQFCSHQYQTAVVLFAVSHILHVLSQRRMGAVCAMKVAGRQQPQTVARIKHFATFKQLIHYPQPPQCHKAQSHNCNLLDQVRMEVERLTRNDTIFHPGQIYWIILLQSTVKFLIHSVRVSSTRNATLVNGWTGTIINTPYEQSRYSIPISNLSQLCGEDVNVHQNFKTFYCENSSPSFLHQLVIFCPDRLHTDVSRGDTRIQNIIFSLLY